MEYFLHVIRDPAFIVIVQVLTLVVLAFTLLFLVWYTILTRDISRATQEQAEASQKPVIVLQCVPMERYDERTVPQAGRLVFNHAGDYTIKNIGTGPALNLSFDFVPVDSASDDPNRYAWRFPYVAPTDTLGVTHPPEIRDRAYRFTARYESLSGKKYSTEMKLQEVGSRGFVTLQEDWVFKRL